MTPEEFAKLIQEKASEIAHLQNRVLPVKAGAAAKAHFQDNFRKSGFVNGGLQSWQPKKNRTDIRRCCPAETIFSAACDTTNLS